MISLLFVFAAMAEFSLVLFVNQIQEWKNTQENCKCNGSKSEKSETTPIYKVSKVSSGSPEVESETTKAVTAQVTADQETRNVPLRSGTCSKLHGLRLTTKIDLAGFVLFNFSYLIFNIVYWVPVLDHFYEED